MSYLLNIAKKNYSHSLKYQTLAILIHVTSKAKTFNDIHYQLRLGHLYKNRHLEKACYFFKMAALNGSTEAKYELGLLLLHSNQKEALIWLASAAYHEHYDANLKLNSVFICLDNCKSIKFNEIINDSTSLKNQTDAILSYLINEAEHNNLNAQLKLGNFYKNIDPEKACYYFKMAALNGNADAMYYLGYLLLLLEDKEGLIWLEAAAYHGNSESQYEVALHHLLSLEEDDKDIDFITKSLIHAARRGHQESQFLLASLYRDGEYVQEDLNKAIYWFSQAADNGYVDALLELGYIYQYGINKDLGIALHYFILAANAGNKNAKENINEIVEELKLLFK